jgi:hypothetical protein
VSATFRRTGPTFGPHFQPDPRISGIGLGFFRSEVDGHRVVGQDGILSGFNSALLVAPDEGVGIVAFTNRWPGAFAWLQIDLSDLGMAPVRVVFARGPDGRVTAAHTNLGGQPWSLVRRDGGGSRRAWLTPVLGAVTIAGALGLSRRRSRMRRSGT